MITGSNFKWVNLINPTTGSSAVTSTQVDTEGYSYMTIVINSTGVASNPSAISLEFSNTSGSGFAGDPYFTGGTSANNFTIPNIQASTNNEPYMVMAVDLRGRGRYAELTFTPGASSTVWATAILSRGDRVPESLADMNVFGLYVQA